MKFIFSRKLSLRDLKAICLLNICFLFRKGKMSTNNTTTTYELPSTKYIIVVPAMLLVCLISVITNIRVLLSVHWIRRPLTPTLHMSLSLAAADACSSSMFGIGLLLNSYLPTVWNIHVPCVVQYATEILRLSGIIITVVHLLTLSIHHYLGILKPLRYISMMTTKKITIIVLLLWIVPFLLILTYFLTVPDQDYWLDCDNPSFMSEVTFRYSFTLLFFVPLILMIFCYTHILIIIKKQQRRWAQLSRAGSTRTRGIRNTTCKQRNSMEGNIKAIYTTLLILGSCVIGWVPACLIFLFICSYGCLYNSTNINPNVAFYISVTINVLVILKTLVNPIIYSSRMVEIQVRIVFNLIGLNNKILIISRKVQEE